MISKCFFLARNCFILLAIGVFTLLSTLGGQSQNVAASEQVARSPLPAHNAAALHTPNSSLMSTTVYFPLALFNWPQRWKGVGNPPGYTSVGPGDGFSGIYPSGWLNWSYRQVDSRAEVTRFVAADLQDANYVPMIFCPSEIYTGALTLQEAGDLAKKYPGRVWLLFNEPDNPIGNANDGGQCGYYIFIKKPSFFAPNHPDWAGLGTYLADRYIEYADAIKKADVTASLFPLGMLSLPLSAQLQPTWDRARPIWNAFIAEINTQNAKRQAAHPAQSKISIDGIAIHAYANNPSTEHAGCLKTSLDPNCITTALTDAYNFFQGNPMTQGKSIWITEIGALEVVENQLWTKTQTDFEQPLIDWFNQNIKPGQACQYINKVFWFSTYYPQFTASNLLNNKNPQILTEVGATWRDAMCDLCECPGGPDCP